MSNEEASSSHAVYQQEINIAEENEPMLPKSVKDLLACIQTTINKDKFSSIFKVPGRLRDVNPSSFNPRVVAIGPLHKGREHLKLMEDKKPAYLAELLTEVGSPEETLTKCMKKVRDSIQKIRRCYFGMDKNKFTNDDDDAFAQMMVIDACFILQFINKFSISGDPLSTNRLRSRSVSLDLVLLENQIPFFVLQDIYDLTFKTLESKPSLNEMLYDLLERANPFFEKLNVANLSGEKTPYHILGLLHEFYQPKDSKIPEIEKIPTAHSAGELHKVGVRFKPHEKKLWPMAIEFEQSTHKPTFRMPPVLIDNFFEVVMRNLIVYEQYSPVRNYVTSYVMAMDMLAATPADVAKLAESNVLVSHLGSNEKVSNMISSICKDVTFLDFYYIESWKEAKKYYVGWSKNLGVLKRKHFSTPWKALALIAGIIVFLLTATQFVFRVIAFKKKHL